MLHELFLVHEDSVAQRTVAAPKRVFHFRLLLGAAALPQLAFHVDQLLAHSGHSVDDVFFPAAQRDLVADLIKVAQRFAALAVDAAHGQSQLGYALIDVAHLLEAGKHRQMEHQRRAQSRPGVGGAGGQIAKLRVKAESAASFQNFLCTERFLRRFT